MVKSNSPRLHPMKYEIASQFAMGKYETAADAANKQNDSDDSVTAGVTKESDKTP